MAAPNVAIERLGDTQPDFEASAHIALLAAQSYLDYTRKADNALDRMNLARHDLIDSLPVLQDDEVLAMRLRGRYLVAFGEMDADDVRGDWSNLRELTTPRGSIFTGSSIPPDIDIHPYYGMRGRPERDEPRLPINGIHAENAGHLPPYRLLIPLRALGSLGVAKLADIPPEIRFSPYNSLGRLRLPRSR